MNMYYGRLLRKFCDAFDVDPLEPVAKMPKRVWRTLMEGCSDRQTAETGLKFEGVVPNLRRRYENSESDFVREKLHGYMTAAKCTECEGARLRPAALGDRSHHARGRPCGRLRAGADAGRPPARERAASARSAAWAVLGLQRGHYRRLRTLLRAGLRGPCS